MINHNTNLPGMYAHIIHAFFNAVFSVNPDLTVVRAGVRAPTKPLWFYD